MKHVYINIYAFSRRMKRKLLLATSGIIVAVFSCKYICIMQINIQLVQAIKRSDVGSVHEYLLAGADPNLAIPYIRNSGWQYLFSRLIGRRQAFEVSKPSLIWAFSFEASKPRFLSTNNDGLYSIVQELLRHGANPNSIGRSDGSALMLAAFYNRPDIVRLLIAAGADTRQYGRDALREAIRADSVESVCLLLDKGVNPNVANSYDGTTYLMECVKYSSDIRILKALIHSGADVCAKNIYGKRVIDIALECHASSNIIDFIRQTTISKMYKH